MPNGRNSNKIVREVTHPSTSNSGTSPSINSRQRNQRSTRPHNNLWIKWKNWPGWMKWESDLNVVLQPRKNAHIPIRFHWITGNGLTILKMGYFENGRTWGEPNDPSTLEIFTISCLSSYTFYQKLSNHKNFQIPQKIVVTKSVLGSKSGKITLW